MIKPGEFIDVSPSIITASAIDTAIPPAIKPIFLK